MTSSPGPGLNEANDLEDLADDADQDEVGISSDVEDGGTRAGGLKMLVSAAGSIADKASRDLSLLTVLRTCRGELEAAKLASEKANERLSAVREVYNLATQVLANYTPLDERMEVKKKSSPVSDNYPQPKRLRVKSEPSISASIDVSSEEAEIAVVEENNDVEGQHIMPLIENPVIMPRHHTQGPKMSEELVAQHREAFYRKLVNCSIEELRSYNPPPGSANLKSKSQLAEWIYIARNWNTGADGMDSGAFRSKYKTWYSRMKPVTYNLGRRTGIHLRTLDPEDGEEEGKMVLCRHNKEGTRSLAYLDLETLFDALFEIHSLELGHRGRDATKSLVDERYANIPDGQVRSFIDTCPVCLGKKNRLLTVAL